jgi:hypothetical protein
MPTRWLINAAQQRDHQSFRNERCELRNLASIISRFAIELVMQTRSLSRRHNKQKLALGMTGFITVLALLCLFTTPLRAQATLAAARDDQINRLKNYVVDAIQPSGLVRDSLVLNGSSFHPASPDAAGFALLGLSALDHLNKLPDAEQRVINILNAHAGNTPGVNPDRSADGHFYHWLNLTNGSRAAGWVDGYTTIGSALLVAGAQFAKNHFADNQTIANLANELTSSIDFNAAINPSLDGRIYLLMNQFGGGEGGSVVPWNEFMLVESLALRQFGNNDRALAVKDMWLDPDNIPQISMAGIPTLTDNASDFAPDFWVQQMHFFNGDFRHSAEFEQYFENQRIADEYYSAIELGEDFRYGLTAGVSPQGYNADRIDANPSDAFDTHPNNVFSPEAVAAFGDMDTFLEFYNSQFPTSDPRYKYGLVRESATQPSWVPGDAGLVDHLFLLFGLVESIDADFFADRMFPGLVDGDFDYDGDVDGRDLLIWQRGDSPSPLSTSDLALWQTNYGGGTGGLNAIASQTAVPEPSAMVLVVGAAILLTVSRTR